MNAGTMTAAERAELGKLVRLRGKVAKYDVATARAKREADMEAELSARFAPTDAAWKACYDEGRRRVAELDAEVARICEARGIRPEFRPSAYLGWNGRGENAAKERRAELRRAGLAELDRCQAAAFAKVERDMAEHLTALATGLITSDEARAFLAAMPSIDDLMPRVMLSAMDVIKLPSGAR